MSDSKKCPACGTYQRLGMLCMKCARAAASAVTTTPRAGMSLGTDYFGIEGPSCVEWVKEEQAPFVGFVHHQLDPNMITVPMAQMREWQNRIEALRAEVNAHGLKFEAVISHPDPAKAWTPPSADFVMTELQDPDSMLNRGLADTLDALERDRIVATHAFGGRPTLTEQEVGNLLAELEEKLEEKPLKHITFTPVMEKWRELNGVNGPSPNDVDEKCFPYLQEDVYIPSCQVVGKGTMDSCKHLIGRLDYCHECEHEHDEPIDLSEESI